MTNKELLLCTRKILHKEPNDRTKADIAVLARYFKTNSIFEKLKLNPEDLTLKEQLFISMRIKEWSK